MSQSSYLRKVMPRRLNDLLHEITSATKAPLEMVASIMLPTISTVVQHQCRMTIKPKLEVPVSLFVITIAESGERKSGVQNLLFKAIANVERQRNAQASQKASEHRMQFEIWKGKVDALKNALNRAVLKGKPIDDIERELLAALEAEPPLIPERKLLYVDTTAEALLAGMHESSPTAPPSATLIHDEFGQFCQGPMAGRLPLLNALWSGQDCLVDRKTGASFTLTNASLTLLLQAQPEVFRRFIAKQGEQARGNGFLARVLLACPVSTQGSRYEDGSTMECPSLDWFYNRCEQLLNRSEHRTLRFSSQAQHEWYQVANYYEQQMNPGGLYFGARDFASKAAENIARIAANLHVFLVDDSDEVSSEMLMHAIDLMNWYGHQFLSIMGAQNPMIEQARDLTELENWIRITLQQKRWNYMHKSFLMQYGPNRLRNREKLDLLLGILCSTGSLAMGQYQKKWVIYIPMYAYPVQQAA